MTEKTSLQCRLEDIADALLIQDSVDLNAPISDSGHEVRHQLEKDIRDASNLITTLRAKVEEAYIYVVESECYCLPRAIPGDGMCERCVWLEGRDDG